MAAEDDGKTEEPSSKRLDEARTRGEVPQTQEMKMLASLFAAFIIFTLLSAHIALDVKAALTPLIDHPNDIRIETVNDLVSLMTHLAISTLLAILWPFAVVYVVTIGMLAGQTRGILWSPSRLIPDFARLNPLDHLKKMISTQQLVELIKHLIKLGVVGTVMVMIIRPHTNEFQNLSNLSLAGMLDYVHKRVFTLILVALLLQAALTVGDFILARMRFMDQMKMTKQEVRDEHKQQEGDPMIKAKLRSLRMRRARQRMMQAVPDADVVVTNPTHFAVALKYDTATMVAPVLVAKGADLIAKRIRELADENEVPIVENPPLARALFATVELDQEIPPEHYKAVAEVIGYVMRLKGKLPARKPS